MDGLLNILEKTNYKNLKKNIDILLKFIKFMIDRRHTAENFLESLWHSKGLDSREAIHRHCCVFAVSALGCLFYFRRQYGKYSNN